MLTAVIVTHNSQRVLPRCLEALQDQTQPADHIVLVDSGSEDTVYLERYMGETEITLLLQNNIGFSAANNMGVAKALSTSDFVLFLNPDTFLDPGCIAQALNTMDQNPDVGVLTGKLLWYDMLSDKATDLFDSTGIFRNWYGRWYDRGQQDEDRGLFDDPGDVPAVCGALMFCRQKALQEVLLTGGEVFDPDFFMYKEDIELCLRLRKAGKRIYYQPRCKGWHARGWDRQRKNMSRELRKMAAKNEVLLYTKHPSPYILWALCKYALVKAFNL